MKILITMYNINIPVGIINHNENLIAGLQNIGHEVNFVELVWRTSVNAKKCKDYTGYVKKASGIPVHQGKGWLFPFENRVAYKGELCLKRWKKMASEYDLIIWQIPVPTKQRDNEGNSDWLELYNLPKNIKQIAVIHDGNMAKSYPWIHQVSEHLDGLACVHPCAYHGAAGLDIPRALIFNPQLTAEKHDKPSWEMRSDGFISMQTFKGWKHVDDLVRAMAHLNPCIDKRLAGGGIEHNYMTSKEKCKEKYFVSQDLDPDIDPIYYGEKIWDVAISKGMQWYGYLSEDEVRKHLREVKCMVDPSWSIAYAKTGDHFNRVVIDGMIEGAIPIARNLGVATNSQGIGEVLKPDENYMMVPHDATPLEFANVIEDTLSLPNYVVQEILENNLVLLDLFSRHNIANQYIELANNEPTGYYKKLEVGVLSPAITKKTQQVMTEFFKYDGVNYG